jgi:hypothetical protein
MRFKGVWLICLLWTGNTVLAQRSDTTNKVKQHSPHLASVLSSVVPGGGQFYNHKYWKIPIIYGGMAFTGYQFLENRQLLLNKNQEFRDLYAAGSQPTPQQLDERDQFRELRDGYGIAFVAIYALQIIDATVDAHFFKFDINQKLSFQFFPENGELAQIKLQLH